MSEYRNIIGSRIVDIEVDGDSVHEIIIEDNSGRRYSIGARYDFSLLILDESEDIKDLEKITEHGALMSELSVVKKILTSLLESHVIERESLKGRIEQIESKISSLSKKE